MYAIVETDGRQYKVAPGDTIQVERLPIPLGDKVELDRVLLVVDDEDLRIGRPVVDGAKVVATVSGEGKGKKVLVFKYKPHNRYRRKMGHRQPYTQLTIENILLD